MRLKTFYKVWPSHFADEVCDRAIAFGDGLQAAESILMKDSSTKARDSTIAWLNRASETDWLFGPIDQCVQATNQELWRFKITASENIQYTKYRAGQHYDWHVDQWEDPYPKDDARWPGLIRKFSVSVNLSAAADYEGGDFELETVPVPPANPKRTVGPIVEVRKRGSVIIFPSHLYHRVTTVTQGTRIALVTWFLGPPFS